MEYDATAMPLGSLQPGQTRVLFLRTFPGDRLDEAWRLGRTLTESGVPIGAIFRSPQQRAVETAAAIMRGACGGGNCFDIIVRDDLDGLEAEDPELSAMIQDAADAVGVTAMQFQIDPRTADHELAKTVRLTINRRGWRGAECVRSLVNGRDGQTVLVVSHGGCRIEPTIARLCSPHVPPELKGVRLLEVGEMAEVVLNRAGRVVGDVTYHTQLRSPAVAA